MRVPGGTACAKRILTAASEWVPLGEGVDINVGEPPVGLHPRGRCPTRLETVVVVTATAERTAALDDSGRRAWFRRTQVGLGRWASDRRPLATPSAVGWTIEAVMRGRSDPDMGVRRGTSLSKAERSAIDDDVEFPTIVQSRCTGVIRQLEGGRINDRRTQTRGTARGRHRGRAERGWGACRGTAGRNISGGDDVPSCMSRGRRRVLNRPDASIWADSLCGRRRLGVPANSILVRDTTPG